jgi:APA family basic amino acid/polyamine antiporter
VGRAIAAGLLFVSTAATLHVTLLTYARVAYALAKDTPGFGLLARVSRRGHVPVNAVLMNGALAILLVLAGTFDTLSNYFIFNTWVFFVAVGVALFVLRRREPALTRPYRAFGYPVVPAIYVTLGAWLVIQTAISTPQSSLIGLAIVGVSASAAFIAPVPQRQPWLQVRWLGRHLWGCPDPSTRPSRARRNRHRCCPR